MTTASENMSALCCDGPLCSKLIVITSGMQPGDHTCAFRVIDFERVKYEGVSYRVIDFGDGFLLAFLLRIMRVTLKEN